MPWPPASKGQSGGRAEGVGRVVKPAGGGEKPGLGAGIVISLKRDVSQQIKSNQ